MANQGRDRFLPRRLTGRVATLSMIVGVVCLWLFSPWSLTALLSSVIRNGLAVLTVLTRVPDAIALVREEHDRTAAEREAFDQFARRVASLDVDDAVESRPQQSTGGHSGETAYRLPGASADSTTATSATTAIQDAYRETVMAVPHYEEEYDESFEEHVAQEFGADIAVALSENDVVTPQLRDALVTASLQARDERSDLIARLETERERLQTTSTSLEQMQDAIATVEASLSRRSDCELADAWDRLEELESDCRTRLRQRQCQIASDGREGGVELQEYLYATQDWTYPILGDSLAGIDRVKRAKQRVVETMLRRG